MNNYCRTRNSALLFGVLAWSSIVGAQTFYTSSGPDPQGDDAWQAAAVNFEQDDFEGFAAGDFIETYQLASGGTATFSLVGADVPGLEVSDSDFFVTGQPGTVFNHAILNRAPNGARGEQMRIEFSPPVEGFGIWVYDNGGSIANSAQLIADGVASAIIDANPGDPDHTVEGFLGVIDPNGISEIIVEVLQQDGVFDLDQIQILSGYVPTHEFFTSNGPNPDGDMAWQTAVDGEFIEEDFEDYLLGEYLEYYHLPEGVVGHMSLTSAQADGLEVHQSNFFVDGQPGTVFNQVLLNRSPDGNRGQEMLIEFSSPVYGFGAWIYDDQGSQVSHARLIVDGVTSPILDANPGEPDHALEGFIGVVDPGGISTVIIDTELGGFELDHMQIALGHPSPSRVEVDNLRGTRGYAMNGEAPGDLSGDTVSWAGDVNGDGTNDILIAAPWADTPNGASETGVTYVVFGGDDLDSPVELGQLNGTNGFAIYGINEDDFSGRGVIGLGDINGDPFDDILIGADKADPEGREDAGQAYVIFGSDTFPTSMALSDINGTNGFAINGVDPGDRLGWSVGGGGDINGDGVPDIVLGAFGADPSGVDNAGATYIIFGFGHSNYPHPLDLSVLNGADGFVIEGASPTDESGFSVAIAGDFNDDGKDDLVIGTQFGDPSGREDAGISYLVYGREAGELPPLRLADLDGIDGFAINGITEFDWMGHDVNAAGDVNHDGYADIVIGAFGIDPMGESNGGGAYVVFGRPDNVGPAFELSTLNGLNGFVIAGTQAHDHAGNAVSGVGDINSDSVDDILLGAHWADPAGKEKAGAAYIIYGQKDWTESEIDVSKLDGSTGYVIWGIAENDHLSHDVSGLGDVNGDYKNDLIIGATLAAPHGTVDAGQSYVIFGGPILFGGECPWAMLNVDMGLDTTSAVQAGVQARVPSTAVGLQHEDCPPQ